MKRWNRFAGVLVLLAGLTIPGIVGAQPLDYRLGPGDVLSIGVWGYSEMQYPEVAIRQTYSNASFPPSHSLQ